MFSGFAQLWPAGVVGLDVGLDVGQDVGGEGVEAVVETVGPHPLSSYRCGFLFACRLGVIEQALIRVFRLVSFRRHRGRYGATPCDDCARHIQPATAQRPFCQAHYAERTVLADSTTPC